jgi:hypothetical protein
MRISAQEPTSSRFAPSNRATSGLIRQTHPALHVPSTIGNRVVQQSLAAHVRGLDVWSGVSAAASLGHAFGRVPVFPLHAAAEHGPLTDAEASETEVEGGEIAIGQEYSDSLPPTPAWGPGTPGAPPAPAPAPVPSPALPAWTIISHATAPAPDGATPDTRTTIGVCETIEFDAGGEVVDWSATKGWPQTEPGKAKLLWAAPEVGGIATITATSPSNGETRTLDMTILAPTTVQYKKKFEVAYRAGTVGAGMRLEGTFLPLNVTFGWIAWKEDPGLATGVTGYFAWLRKRHRIPLRHEPSPNFRRVGWDNHFCCDRAELHGPYPAPWTPGAFQWAIPNRYRCEWSIGMGHVFDDTTQSFSIDASGTVTVTKEGESVSRPP